ncbi:MAG: hydroxyisourate hydrolase [Sphingomonas fennica]
MKPLLAALSSIILAGPATAADISTHVLDLARGIGGRGVPVALFRQERGAWSKVGSAATDENGRIRSFDAAGFPAGTYRLVFDMSAYPDAAAAPFFPEIVLTFRVADAGAHYHVPVVVSPYGYSTYRGN